MRRALAVFVASQAGIIGWFITLCRWSLAFGAPVWAVMGAIAGAKDLTARHNATVDFSIAFVFALAWLWFVARPLLRHGRLPSGRRVGDVVAQLREEEHRHWEREQERWEQQEKQAQLRASLPHHDPHHKPKHAR